MYFTSQTIHPAEFLTSKPKPEHGATASFLGWVRNHHEGKAVKYLYYECYEALAEKQMNHIIFEIEKKYSDLTLRILHRKGLIQVGEVAVAIEASSTHRHEAFLACREAIERIKQELPIWKQEFYEEGGSEWVLCTHFHEKQP